MPHPNTGLPALSTSVRLGALAPSQLPTSDDVGSFLRDHAIPEVTAVELTGALDQLHAVLDALPPRGLDLETKSQLEDAEHDKYFRIERIENTPANFVAMAHQARVLLLEELRDYTPPDDMTLAQRIDRGLVDMIACMRGGTANSAPSLETWTSHGTDRDPMSRWVRGHQVFVALTQGLVAAFRSMAVAIRAGDAAEVGRWADLAVTLLEGSTATFQFTGDFSTDVYTDVVRPSMMPPHTPFCLSGMMSVDHRHLVTVIRDMKPALKALHQMDPARHARIAGALRTVYDSHIHTCERFVGNQPSIMTEGKTEKSGVALLEHFRTIRLRPFAEAEAPQRLAAATAAAVAPQATPRGACPFGHTARPS